MSLSPIIVVHMTAAILALATGPVALWARKSRTQRTKLHRAFGYAWVTMMLITAISAIFLTARVGPTWFGFGLIHILVPVTLIGLFTAFWSLFKGNISGHRKAMQNVYVGGCVVAGAFALLPGRFLGHMLLTQWRSLV